MVPVQWGHSWQEDLRALRTYRSIKVRMVSPCAGTERSRLNVGGQIGLTMLCSK